MHNIIDLLDLSKQNNLKLNIPSKIPSSLIVPHITIPLPFNSKTHHTYHSIVNKLKQKISSTTSTTDTSFKGRKLRNKTLHHHGLGTNFNYEIDPITFIKPPTYQTHPKAVYPIIISDYACEETFAFMFDVALHFTVSFEIYFKSTNSKHTCTIANVVYVDIDDMLFKNVLIFNSILIKNNFVTFTNDKALLLPLVYNACIDVYEVNVEMIENAIDVYKHKRAKDVDVHDKELYNKLFISKRKSNFALYELYQVINKDEECNEFIKKICSYDDEYYTNVKKEYFTHCLLNNKEYHKYKAIDFFTNFTLTNCPAITTYRSYLDKNNINYNEFDNEEYFLYVDAPKKQSEISLYTKNCINNGNNNASTSNSNTHSHLYLHTFLPLSQLSYCFLSKQHYILLNKIPYIYNSFKQMLYPYKFLKETTPLGNDYSQYLTTYNYKYFTWALTPPSLLMPYSYDTIETLGDTILKFTLTSQLIFAYDMEGREGYIERARVKKINNKFLYEKGKLKEIYKYVYSKINVNNNETYMELNDKNISDIIEATIAAFYLLRNNLVDSYNYILSCDICDNMMLMKVEDNTLKRIGAFNVGEDVLRIDMKDYSFLMLSENDFVFKNMCMKYNIGTLCNSGSNSNTPATTRDEMYTQLEKLIGYTFNNKDNIAKAFRHGSISKNDNYEIFELLGDSIVELFVILSTYNTYIPFLYHNDDDNINNNNNNTYIKDIKQHLLNKAKSFDCYKATKIKSFLCSNTFMCKLSYVLTLPLYIQCGDSYRNEIDLFMSNDNVERIINRKLNEYESPQSFNPKIIADVFESLVGAIYFDSNIGQCFKFLNKIYKPFIIYTWFYFDELKYSAINDFTHLCTFKYKTAPEFHARVHNGEHYVDIYLNNKKEFTGKGESVESAKANAAILGLKYFSNK